VIQLHTTSEQDGDGDRVNLFTLEQAERLHELGWPIYADWYELEDLHDGLLDEIETYQLFCDLLGLECPYTFEGVLHDYGDTLNWLRQNGIVMTHEEWKQSFNQR
jgi:hypothetical protein